MSQDIFADIDPDNTDGGQLAVLLGQFRDAVISGFSGDTRPPELLAGGYWIDTSLQDPPDNKWLVKLWTGVIDITLFDITTNSGVVTIPGTSNSFNILRTSEDTTGPALTFEKRRTAGTGQVKAGDSIGTFTFSGRDNGGIARLGARIDVVALEDFTGTVYGSKISIKTVDSTTNVLSEKIVLGDTIEVKAPVVLHGLTYSQEDIATAANINAMTVTEPVVRMTGSTATNINGINHLSKSKVVFIHNVSTAVVTLVNDSGVATSSSDRIILPAATIKIKPKETLGLFYDVSVSRWKPLSSSSADIDYDSVSTGVISGGVISINADPTKIDVSGGTATVTDYATDPLNPVTTIVAFGPFTAATITNLASQDDTWIFIDSAGALFQQSTPPSPGDRRLRAYLGRVNHPSRSTIAAVITLPDFIIDTNSQFYDLLDALGAFSFEGNKISAAGANLTFNKSAGKIFRRSSNYANDDQNPHYRTLIAGSPQAFFKATATATITPSVTSIDPANYDSGGTVTAIPGGANVSSIQRVYAFSNGAVVVQYGQHYYSTLAEAQAAVVSEDFTLNPGIADGGVLLGLIVVKKSATALNDPSQAVFIPAGKFGLGGGGGGAAEAFQTVTKTANATLAANEKYVYVDATAGNVTITLPAAVTGNIGEIHEIQRVDAVEANTVTIVAAGSDTINGVASDTLPYQWNAKRVQVYAATKWGGK